MKTVLKYAVLIAVTLVMSFTFPVATVFIIEAIGWIFMSLIGLLFVFLIFALSIAFLHDNRIKRFKKINEGKYFLWYSSNKRIREQIESGLLPALKVKFVLIYNNRGEIVSTLGEEELDYIKSETNHLKLPRLIKIGKEKILAQSFYNEVKELKDGFVSAEVFEQLVKKRVMELEIIN